MNLTPRWKYVAVFAAVSTVVIEGVTVAMRFGGGMSAETFIAKDPPLLMRIHHMFWCVPLLIVVPLVWRKTKLSGALSGVAVGLVASDLVLHFVVLPLTVGNTGWHWP